MPLYRRLPKRGFNNAKFAKDYVEVNLGRVQAAIDAGRLDGSAPIDAAALRAARVIDRPRDGVRLLAKGSVRQALTFQVAGASRPAIAAVTEAGGRVLLPGGEAAAPPAAETPSPKAEEVPQAPAPQPPAAKAEAASPDAAEAADTGTKSAPAAETEASSDEDKPAS